MLERELKKRLKKLKFRVILNAGKIEAQSEELTIPAITVSDVQTYYLVMMSREKPGCLYRCWMDF